MNPALLCDGIHNPISWRKKIIKGLKMEINITSFFYTVAPRDLSASVAEIGANAGADTWQASCEASEDSMLLDSDDKKQAFRAFVRSSGGWNDEEVNEWSDKELNALFLQWIAGDMREMGIDSPVNSPDGIDWESIEAEQQEGIIPSNIFRGEDGSVYFYAGC